MKKVLSISIALILILSMFSACSKGEEKEVGADKNKKVLIMGTSADYKPYEYVEASKSDEIIGFDVDIAKYIGKELGYEVKVKDMDFGGLLASLSSGKVDFVMAGMTPTAERKENADFTDIYFVAKNMIVSKKDSNIKSLQDLKGKKVGVQTGSIQEEKANEFKKQVDLKAEGRDRVPEIVQEIKAGRFDAAILEDTIAKHYLEKVKGLQGIEIQEAPEEVGAAIALPKNSDKTAEFNKVIQKMKENGEMNKLVKKWFGSEK
ncbi:transporter substrate-binding domain-containing protein [Bacillus cytotoxicus]|uniref:Extracellular solute-binding protein family 3 n=1 Tax=Bacillus cytotoxicus (strain DSM 22905 / CIP 110041 / 391-98 / NVH 391-98) TaxID=315749 RepID=A7GSH4_BACCN|nr:MULTISPECIES: transporter substrate-binding domain-containing protein [Bacillus cereus group]ABS23082.1 extracellular solute-binding protein family 3 [Bacillus cytotoxicus NVH 391-98]AWC33738.1 ABC transporter substrate-binding protein [Bacillus cytotoxicus]AWC37717.1 ABC transporter substrate-binding protein [Bacillus cytotoxicus]AWC45710.1 ABC transporter substrate-binding protein [Bacillus cytotoxicus]AWC61939.1 ABC transporter substrate-binding protein [Bacillus cytotoxicus]